MNKETEERIALLAEIIYLREVNESIKQEMVGGTDEVTRNTRRIE